MDAFHNLAITGVLPEVSCTNRPAGFFCAHAARHKSWCAANVTAANVNAPLGARTAVLLNLGEEDVPF